MALTIGCCDGGLEERPMTMDGMDGYCPEPDGGFEWFGLWCPRCGMEYYLSGTPGPLVEEDEEVKITQ